MLTRHPNPVKGAAGPSKTSEHCLGSHNQGPQLRAPMDRSWSVSVCRGSHG
ncbi:MAG: hypothetical protein MI923_27485 [Phycisphaerales bacterium]|nr:hypothetical protein [Phycisphaerales bacterium]